MWMSAGRLAQSLVRAVAVFMLSLFLTHHWRRGVRERLSHPSDDLLLVRKFPSKNTKSGAKNPTFRGTIETLSTCNVLCRKLAAVCKKFVNFCPSYFFNPRCRWYSLRLPTEGWPG